MSFDAKRPLAEAQPQPTAFEVRVLDGLERKRPGRKKKMKENLIKELLSFNPQSPPAMRMLLAAMRAVSWEHIDTPFCAYYQH